MYQSGPLCSAQRPDPLLGMSLMPLSPEAAERFEPSGRKAAHSNVLEAEMFLQATGAGENVCWLRKRMEKTLRCEVCCR